MNLAIMDEVEKRVLDTRLTVSEIERRAGLKQGTLRNIINGKSKNPTIQVLVSLTKVLGCSIEELVGIPSTAQPISETRKKIEKTLGPINYDLLDNVYKLVIDKSKQLDREVTLEDINKFIVDIYSFSQKAKTNYPDKTFADWYFERNNT